MMRRLLVASIVLDLALAGCGGAETTPEVALLPGQGVVQLRVLDDAGIVPARLRLRDSQGVDLVPASALTLIGDCRDRTTPETPADVAAGARSAFEHARSDSLQFYTDGLLRATLPAGRYAVTGYRGPEYRRADQDFEVQEGGQTNVDLHLERWVDMAAEGWFSADTHLHVPRPDGSRDKDLLVWLGAEDLHVGNLLQWGNAIGFFNATQADFTPVVGGSELRPTILLPGQENPRTELMGHAMGLGLSRAVNLPRDYLNYSRFATELRRAGGLVGIGHAGEWGGDAAIALLGSWKLLDFVEVFTFRTPDYSAWYESLDVGLHVAATAGSDFPCGGGQVPPGSPRVYARVEGVLSAASWADAVRSGRTFVTNGPMIDITVDGRGVGESLVLRAANAVTVTGRLRFDAGRETIRAFDLLRNGKVINVFSVMTGPGEIAFTTKVLIHEASWLAVRAFGSKLGAAPGWGNSFAHSGVVFVRPAASPPATATARAAIVRRAWRDRLVELFTSLADRSQHDRLIGVGKDRAAGERFTGQALSLMREIQRTLEYGLLAPHH